MRSIFWAAVLILGSASASWATNVNVGVLTLLQDDGLQSVTFSVSNLTGFGEDFADGFNVQSPLDFLNVLMTVSCGNAACSGDFTSLFGSSGPHTYSLGTIASGNTDSSVVLGSADTFSHVQISFDFGTTVLILDADGFGAPAPFTGSASSSLTLLPAIGTDLVPIDISGNNIGNPDVGILVDVEGTPTVPEPSSLLLLASGISGALLHRRFQQGKQ